MRTYRMLLTTVSLLLLSTLSAKAQTEETRDKSVYVEILGASNGIGINYDARFKHESPWGYRVGVGFGYAQSNWFFSLNQSTRVYSAPIEVNYLAGKKRSKFEVGLGINLGLYNDHYSVNVYEPMPQAQSAYTIKKKSYTENNFDAFAFTNVGYRHVSRKGFQFRVGVTSGLVLTKNRNTSREFLIAPYISFGKAF